MPREWTEEEIREKFLDHIRMMSKYWANTNLKRPEFEKGIQEDGGEVQYRLNGLCHSILAMLDGCSMLPGFLIIPSPHKDDKEFNISEGENWYPQVPDVEFVDIGGALHEQFHKSKES